MMKLKIRKTEEGDIPQIVALIKEFAEFENLFEWFQVTEEKLREAIFAETAFVQAMVAFDGKSCVGYALFYPIFRSFRGERSMFLEDLYVSPKMRGKGLGFAMLKEVARMAKAQGFVRMDWQALKWNEPAINFYKNLGAETDDENFDFRLRGAAFDILAS
jgi:GNAT superfamily N-acetyltransferase